MLFWGTQRFTHFFWGPRIRIFSIQNTILAFQTDTLFVYWECAFSLITTTFPWIENALQSDHTRSFECLQSTLFPLTRPPYLFRPSYDAGRPHPPTAPLHEEPRWSPGVDEDDPRIHPGSQWICNSDPWIQQHPPARTHLHHGPFSSSLVQTQTLCYCHLLHG